jgi:hypothetical protein
VPRSIGLKLSVHLGEYCKGQVARIEDNSPVISAHTIYIAILYDPRSYCFVQIRVLSDVFCSYLAADSLQEILQIRSPTYVGYSFSHGRGIWV